VVRGKGEKYNNSWGPKGKRKGRFYSFPQEKKGRRVSPKEKLRQNALLSSARSGGGTSRKGKKRSSKRASICWLGKKKKRRPHSARSRKRMSIISEKEKGSLVKGGHSSLREGGGGDKKLFCARKGGYVCQEGRTFLSPEERVRSSFPRKKFWGRIQKKTPEEKSELGGPCVFPKGEEGEPKMLCRGKKRRDKILFRQATKQLAGGKKSAADSEKGQDKRRSLSVW